MSSPHFPVTREDRPCTAGYIAGTGALDERH
jgi:hypothetical protein